MIHRFLAGRYCMLAAIILAMQAPLCLASEVGFTRAQAADPAGPALDVALWYPTMEQGSPQRLDLFMQDVAPDAPVEACCHPLIVISHGNGSSLAGHYDTALALAHAGFIVAAVTHTADNYRDHTNELRLEDRPRHVRALIDFALSQWGGHNSIAAGKIGIFGFSAGGFTALVAIGGKPDFSRIPPYCASHAESFVCQLRKAHGLSETSPVGPDPEWIADPRIKAAVIAAPGLGFTFTRAGLSGVAVPIQLWAASDDHVLPVADNAEAVRDALPTVPEYHVVPGAGHLDFLAPCSAALSQAVPAICNEAHGFDRTAFHQSFNEEVVHFFQRTLDH